jgi:hypothetical protein
VRVDFTLQVQRVGPHNKIEQNNIFVESCSFASRHPEGFQNKIMKLSFSIVR